MMILPVSCARRCYARMLPLSARARVTRGACFIYARICARDSIRCAMLMPRTRRKARAMRRGAQRALMQVVRRGRASLHALPRYVFALCPFSPTPDTYAMLLISLPYFSIRDDTATPLFRYDTRRDGALRLPPVYAYYYATPSSFAHFSSDITPLYADDVVSDIGARHVVAFQMPFRRYIFAMPLATIFCRHAFFFFAHTRR